MNIEPIIPSLLWNDKYKYSMGYIAFQQFSDFIVEYKFKCRSEIIWTEDHVEQIKKQVLSYCLLTYREKELNYLSKEFPNNYINFLRNWYPKYEHFDIKLLDNGELNICITGPWYWTIYYEVPLLAIIGVIYHKLRPIEEQKEIELEAYRRLDKKYNDLKNSVYTFKFAEMGSRRIFDIMFQWNMIKKMQDISNFIGTSNTYYAMLLNQYAIGTQAHEYFMIGQILPIPLYMSQKRMLEVWRDTYQFTNPRFMVALTDIIGIDYFIKDYNYELANSYQGTRHDSGCPFEWGDKTIGHYDNLGIDPKTKTGVWSDKLDFDLAQEIENKFYKEINVLPAFGTYLVNDTIYPAMQNVIKPVRFNGKDVAKISDSKGKNMCDNPEYENYLIWSFKNRR